MELFKQLHKKSLGINPSQEPRVKTRGMLAQHEDAVQATAMPMASKV